jgi:hypothetical protein
MVQPSRLQHGLAPLGKGIDMKRTNLIWLGGPAAMVGGVAHTAPGLLGTVFGGYVLRLAGVRRYGAIAALHALQRERYGLPGALPSLTVFIGVGLMLGSNLGLTEGLPWPLPERIFMVGVLVAALGMGALGLATIAARVLPWWCGIALMVGGFGFAGPMLALSWTGFFMGLLAGAAWVVAGYALLRARARLPERPSQVQRESRKLNKSRMNLRRQGTWAAGLYERDTVVECRSSRGF